MNGLMNRNKESFIFYIKKLRHLLYLKAFQSLLGTFNFFYYIIATVPIKLYDNIHKKVKQFKQDFVYKIKISN